MTHNSLIYDEGQTHATKGLGLQERGSSWQFQQPCNQCLSFKSASLYCGSRLIQAYINPQQGKPDLKLTYGLRGIFGVVVINLVLVEQSTDWNFVIKLVNFQLFSVQFDYSELISHFIQLDLRSILTCTNYARLIPLLTYTHGKARPSADWHWHSSQIGELWSSFALNFKAAAVLAMEI